MSLRIITALLTSLALCATATAFASEGKSAADKNERPAVKKAEKKSDAAPQKGATKAVPSPEETFARIKAAMFKKEFRTVFELYSRETQKSLEEAIVSIKQLPAEVLPQVAESLFTTTEELMAADAVQYLGILFTMADKVAKDPEMKKIMEAQGQKPVNWREMQIKEVKIKGDSAEMFFKNQPQPMYLIKEEGIWKFHMKQPENKQ